MSLWAKGGSFLVPWLFYSKYCWELAYGISDVWTKYNLYVQYLQLAVIYLGKEKKKKRIQSKIETWVFLKEIAFEILENKLWHSGALPKNHPKPSISTVPLRCLAKVGKKQGRVSTVLTLWWFQQMTSSVTSFSFSNNENQTWNIKITQNWLLIQPPLSHL